MTHIIEFDGKPALRSVIVAAIFAAACCTSLSTLAQDPSTPAEMSDLEWVSLETRLRDRANEIANSRSFFDDDRRPIMVQVRLDRPSRVLFLELDASFSKDVGSLELEDFQGAIDVGSEDLTALIAGFAATEWIIDGKDMDYWFNQSIASAGVAAEVHNRGNAAQAWLRDVEGSADWVEHGHAA